MYSFTGPDGAEPTGLTQAGDGSFYGTTFQGGSFNNGTIFKMDTQGTVTVLHSFQGTDGANPWTTMLMGNDGNLYGTTGSGGTEGYGVVFRTDTAGNFTVLHSFVLVDGGEPYNLLIQGPSGFIYGTTFVGGPAPGDYGTIFKMDSAGNITTLHAFGTQGGGAPDAGLLIGTDGNFYGSTSDYENNGGSYGGEIFSFTDSTLAPRHKTSPGTILKPEASSQ